MALDEALEGLGRHDPEAAELVKLRFFAGLTRREAAEALGIGRREADGLWALRPGLALPKTRRRDRPSVGFFAIFPRFSVQIAAGISHWIYERSVPGGDAS